MRSLPIRFAVFACITSLILPALPADACTSLLIKHPDGPLMVKNYDWDVADGLVVINPRGLAKAALVPEGVKPARWTSRYGSVSFNQYGREFPMGGMNETGLAMEVLWLAGSEYPAPGERPSISTLQWVQYCLDSFRSVADVVASASELSIVSSATLHFLACDATGNCAIIEFIGGELVSRSERTLPLPVLTNNTFAESLEYLNRTLGYGGEPVKPEGSGSLARFARAANGSHLARSKPSEDTIGDAFAVLADVAQPTSTQWSIVYELQAGRVHYRTSANPEVRSLDLNTFDLDCTADPLVADILAEGKGDVVLGPATAESNRRVIDAGFGAEEVTAPAPEIIDAIVAYPDRLLCTFDAVE